MRVPIVLKSYWQARHLKFASRAALERHQQRRLRYFMDRCLTRSPWFAAYLNQPLHAWPLMDKALMMAQFDRMNTAGLTLDEVLACAMRAEHSRDFAPTLKGYSVGLSSGTSGARGVFVVSPAEQATWAGVMLAKLLPQGLFSGERVALLLRANSNLYRAVRSPWLSFQFFDLLEAFEHHFERLERYAPTIVVGPAQALRALAQARRAGRISIAPRKLISGAEVLEASEREWLAQTLGPVGEVYQATEGFLGATCAHGTLHLNEAHLYVEPQWLDERRFVPVITDFSRTTQPIVRYRLDDVLVRRAARCPCGSHEMALERIEGRCDDLLRLPGQNGAFVDVIADGFSRAIARILPIDADYRVVQTGPASLSLYVDARAALSSPLFPQLSPQLSSPLSRYQAHLAQYLARLGVATSALRWTLHPSLPQTDFGAKRRRIVRHIVSRDVQQDEA